MTSTKRRGGRLGRAPVVALLSVVALTAVGGASDATAESPSVETELASESPTTEPTSTASAPTDTQPAVDDPATASEGGILRMGFVGTMNNVTPIFWGGSTLLDYYARNLSFPHLVELDLYKGGGYVPGLASSWEASDDLRTWTFTLDLTRSWADGTPITADDVKFSIDETNAFPEVNEAAFSLWRRVESVQILDDETVELTLDEPNAGFLANLPYAAILPQHIWEEFFALGAEATLEQSNEFALRTGGGPFYATDLVPGQSAVLTRNPGYPVQANIERIGIVGYGTGDAALAALQAGEIDVIPQFELTIDVDRVPDGLQLIQATSPGTAMLWINQNPDKMSAPELLNPEVRRALSLAIDRDLINEIAYNGLGEPGSSIIANGVPFHDDSLEPEPYSPDEAAEILDDLGYTVGDDGTRVADGSPMSYTVVVSNRIPVQVFNVVQQNLGDIGIEVTLEQVEEEQFAAEAGAPEGTYTEVNLAINEYFGYGDPSLILGALTTGDQFNLSAYSSAEYDELFAQMSASGDAEERIELSNQMQQLLVAERPVLFLASSPSLTLAASNVTGLEGTPIGALPGDFSTPFLNVGLDD